MTRSQHPLIANPTPEQVADFEAACKQCRDQGVNPFEQVQMGAAIGENGVTYDVDQITYRWQMIGKK